MKELTISREQATTLHNSMCTLRCAIEELESILRPELFNRINHGLSGVESIRKYLFDIIDQEMEDADSIAKKFAKENDIKWTIWSIYSKQLSDEHGFPIDTPIKCFETDGMAFVSGPTYGDLWKTIDRLVHEYCADFGCHIFVEDFRYDPKHNVVRVSFGS